MKDLEICKKCGQHHERCKGHRRRKDTSETPIPCRKFPLNGNIAGLCSICDKRSNRGVNHPNYKDGRSSKYIPQKIQSRLDDLEESRNEGDFLSLKKQIKLWEVRISQLTEKLDGGDSFEGWKAVKKAHLELRSALLSGDQASVKTAMQNLSSAIKEGESENAVWDELRKAQLHLEKLLSSERKKMVEDKYMMSIDEVFILLGMIGGAIRDKIKDANERHELGNELKIIAQKAGFIPPTE